jgi:capsular polysaccharide transport system permease protein
MREILKGLSVQARVIGALFLREVITRYGRHGFGVLWIFIEPMLFTLGITGLWYAGKLHTVVDVPIIEFAVTGYASLLLWRNASNRCVKAFEPNVGLMYHRQVKYIDILYSRVLLEFAGGTGSFALIVLIFNFFELMRLPEDLLLVVVGWFYMMWLGVGLSLIVGSVAAKNETIERIWHVVNYLSLPTTGALFLVDWLPENLKSFVLLVPMVHGTELIRHGYWGGVVNTHESVAYLFSSCMVMTLIGLVLARDVDRKRELE